MPEYLIALSVGPVQGFIAAARRTRDLWFGSYMLSEVSKAAARSLQEMDGNLIFPHPESLNESDPNSSVGNKLMARIAIDDPRGVIEKAKDAARDRWRQLANKARDELDIEALRATQWDAQVNDVLELFGAWVPLSTGYATARVRLERLLAARKMTRDFEPAAESFYDALGYGLPKSSLDAARETVLVEAEQLSRTTRRRLGLGRGEQLDCPALVKRLGGDPEKFPPVTSIALEAWLKYIPEEDLEEVNELYEPLVSPRVGVQLATRVRPRRSNGSRFSKLPFDGELLFPSRIEAVTRELERDEEAARGLNLDGKQARDALESLKRCRNLLHKKHGKPTPYFAVLVADGDRMGAFIDAKDSQEQHVNITRVLTSFAGAARKLIEQHRGACVYAGGDDVLALLPVDTAVVCAKELQDRFAQTVEHLGDKPPTLSVGLGLGHILTPFARLLDLGRRAEKLAKEGREGTPACEKRNALAIIVGVRSGAEVSVRGRWERCISERLDRWTQYFHTDQLSDKTPYDLQEAARRMAWTESRADYRLVAIREIGRVLAKKRGEAGTRELSTQVRGEIEKDIRDHGLDTILAELRVARWLAQKAKD